MATPSSFLSDNLSIDSRRDHICECCCRFAMSRRARSDSVGSCCDWSLPSPKKPKPIPPPPVGAALTALRPFLTPSGRRLAARSEAVPSIRSVGCTGSRSSACFVFSFSSFGIVRLDELLLLGSGEDDGVCDGEDEGEAVLLKCAR